MAIRIITDSTSYLSEAFLSANNIRRISLSVVFEDEVINETEISNEDFYKKMSQVNEFPTSSQPSIEELQNIMESIVKEGDHIVGIFLSSEMSGTYQSAKMIQAQVLDKYPDAKIEILDSRSNCMQLGVQVMSAVNVIKNGGDLEQVVEAVAYTKERSRFVFAPENLEYLRKGGRIGTAKALLGNVLKLKPILTVNDGKTDSITTVRTRSKSIDTLIELFEEDTKRLGLDSIVVHHINCEELAQKLVDNLKVKTGIEAEIRPIGPVIGVHVGPGALGLVYTTKEILGAI